jgi:hypothetical protein
MLLRNQSGKFCFYLELVQRKYDRFLEEMVKNEINGQQGSLKSAQNLIESTFSQVLVKISLLW